jgi:glycosyltransferase involved in cell wall biosynthesis
VAAFRPDVIHSRHVWLLSSMVKDVAPEVPVATHCHATGLRQMALCPELGEEVARGCARNERFCVLHRGHAEALTRKLGVAPDRIRVVGAGYQSAVFHARGRDGAGGMNVLYAGKYSHAKGLPQLLDAVERLCGREPRLVLHVAGDGAGPEAEALRARMAGMGPRVVMHGQLDQEALAGLMRRCAVFVLPSFYEGLPLVLVEAVACGCRLVCTDLPSIRDGLGEGFDRVLDRVNVPRLIGPDVPAPEALPAFVDDLAAGIMAALDRPPIGDPMRTMREVLDRFTWEAVFGRIESLWLKLASGPGRGGRSANGSSA